MATELRSTATFDIEEAGAQSKVTVTHTGFETGSAILAVGDDDGLADGDSRAQVAARNGRRTRLRMTPSQQRTPQ